jgi:threonine/homoserine/homoserine lactone efflux protein
VLAWHLGAVTFLFRWIFRDPKVDMRFLFAGAVLPDLIDLTAVTLLGGSSGQLWAHSLVAPTVIAVVVMATTRRGRRRRAWMALVVAWLFHLLIDQMWLDAGVFFWPLFGVDLAVGSDAFWPAAWERAWSDPWRWILEVIGLVYLVWLAVGYELGEPEQSP